MKVIRCLNCKVILHPTDWKILKQEGKLPYCDDCEHVTMPSIDLTERGDQIES